MSKELAEINGRLAKSAETKACLTECCKQLAALSEADHVIRDATETDVRATTKRMLAQLDRAESDVADEQRKIVRREEALREMMNQAVVYSQGAKSCVDGLRAENDRLLGELETSRVAVDALCAQVAALDAPRPPSTGPGEGRGEREKDDGASSEAQGRRDDGEDNDHRQACSESVSTLMSVDDSFVVGSRSNPAFVDDFTVDGLLPWSSALSSSTDVTGDPDADAASTKSFAAGRHALSLNEMFCKYATNPENAINGVPALTVTTRADRGTGI